MRVGQPNQEDKGAGSFQSLFYIHPSLRWISENIGLGVKTSRGLFDAFKQSRADARIFAATKMLKTKL